jgi:hypothetical protein
MSPPLWDRKHCDALCLIAGNASLSRKGDATSVRGRSPKRASELIKRFSTEHNFHGLGANPIGSCPFLPRKVQTQDLIDPEQIFNRDPIFPERFLIGIMIAIKFSCSGEIMVPDAPGALPNCLSTPIAMTPYYLYTAMENFSEEAMQSHLMRPRPQRRQGWRKRGRS